MNVVDTMNRIGFSLVRNSSADFKEYGEFKKLLDEGYNVYKIIREDDDESYYVDIELVKILPIVKKRYYVNNKENNFKYKKHLIFFLQSIIRCFQFKIYYFIYYADFLVLKQIEYNRTTAKHTTGTKNDERIAASAP